LGAKHANHVKVLVVGSGAREHALVWKCVQSELVERVYCAPGNGGTGGMARNIPIGAADVVRMVEFAKRERIGLVVLGPEVAVDVASSRASPSPNNSCSVPAFPRPSTPSSPSRHPHASGLASVKARWRSRQMGSREARV
jgi:hypothetical protein